MVSAERFYPDASHYDRPRQAGFDQRQYRWRPFEGKEQPSVSQWPQSEAPVKQSVPDYQDYADTPMGLPRGVYRPVQERHEITPHHQGFRFRPLSPAEQVRIKKRNSANRDAGKQRDIVFRPQSQTAHGRDSTVSRQSRYRFRPDKRLDTIERRRVPSYSQEPAFTELYPAPVFRQSGE